MNHESWMDHLIGGWKQRKGSPHLSGKHKFGYQARGGHHVPPIHPGPGPGPAAGPSGCGAAAGDVGEHARGHSLREVNDMILAQKSRPDTATRSHTHNERICETRRKLTEGRAPGATANRATGNPGPPASRLQREHPRSTPLASGKGWRWGCASWPGSSPAPTCGGRWNGAAGPPPFTRRRVNLRIVPPPISDALTDRRPVLLLCATRPERTVMVNICPQAVNTLGPRRREAVENSVCGLAKSPDQPQANLSETSQTALHYDGKLPGCRYRSVGAG